MSIGSNGKWVKPKQWDDGRAKLNIGSGPFPMPFWRNLDARNDVGADIIAHVPPIPTEAGDYDEIFASHVLEHMTRTQGFAFLKGCWRVLKPGGKLGIVVPDFKEAMRLYLTGSTASWQIERRDGTLVRGMACSLPDICDLVVYADPEDPHRAAYDDRTLRDMIIDAGFYDPRPIDRWADVRLPLPAWVHLGFDAVKP